MPITYEDTSRVLAYYRQKLGSSPFDFGAFLIGVVTGYFVLPIVLPIVGFKLVQWAVK